MITTQDQVTVAFTLAGQVGARDFPDWIARHAAKLGIAYDIAESTQRSLSLRATGAAEMVDAFALACSLGPQSVEIEALTFADTSADLRSDGFFSG
ncbi:hypothetical protein [Yoonia sp. SS1-5]|uniref:Acylphosphatase n=1 Tax=Yoonia rhodophyticola TaxID=3137370 RepID=A0AAN0NLA9_9RHOB